MEDSKLDTQILNILNLDVLIEKNIFKKVCFRDRDLEILYEKNINKTENEIFLQGDRIIFLGWICILLYIIFVYYTTIIVVCSIVLSVTSLLIIHLKNLKVISEKFGNLIQILMITIFLNFKIIYLNYMTLRYGEDNQAEIIRTIVFDFISSNLLSLIILDENFQIKLFLLIVNLTSVLISIYSCKNGNCYLVDGLCSICYNLIFHLVKKAWEYNLRSIFSERYTLSKLLNYSYDFIYELNGLHFNRSIKKTLISGKNVKGIINESINEEKYQGSNCKNEDKELFPSKQPDLCESFMKNLILYQSKHPSTKKITLLETLESVQRELKQENKFKSVGIFTNELTKTRNYYEVFYRKFFLTEFNIIDDIFFYDVTNHILALVKIDEENKIKEKLFAKISHEFKTPINSIIGLIETIKHSILNEDKLETIKKLNTIKNLSNYVIYLTNDIIQFASFTTTKSVNINTKLVNFREILEFGYEILKCLLSCSSSKNQNITPILKYNDTIDQIKVYSDEVRIKQIILNFISNSVKFTKSGTIKLYAERIHLVNEIIIKVIDTGVGILDEDQLKLYNEYSLINNKDINNSLGTGLGLSICKNLADSLKFKINTSSKYGIGSTFSLIIPYEIQNDLIYNKYEAKKKKSTKISYLKIQNSNFLSTNRIYRNSIKRPSLSTKNPKKIEIDEEKKIKISKSNNMLSSLSDKIYKPVDSPFKNESVANSVSSQADKSSIGFFPKLKILNLKNYSNLSIESNLDNSFNFEEEEEELPTVRVDHNFQMDYKLQNVFKKKILVIDDNSYICQSIKYLIEKICKEKGIMDIEILIGTDGIDILYLLREDQNKGNLIKCVITDENMEYMNGSQATKIIRQFEKNGKIKPLSFIISTFIDDENIKKYLDDSGSQIVLSKPLNKIDLIEALKNLNII